MGRTRRTPALDLQVNAPLRALAWAGAVYAWFALTLAARPAALLAMGGYHLAFCLWAARAVGPGLPTRGRSSPWRLAAGASLGLLTVLALAAAAGSHMPTGEEKRALLAAAGVPPGSIPFTLAWFLLVNPWAEEIAWRGRVRPALAAWGWRGEVTAAALFGGYHAWTANLFLGPWLALPAAVMAGIGGWVLGLAARDAEGLRVAVAVHAGANAGLAWIAFGAL